MIGKFKTIRSSIEGGGSLMSRRGSLWVVVFFAAAVMLSGCHGDPNVRKQKYLESGKRYSAEG